MKVLAKINNKYFEVKLIDVETGEVKLIEEEIIDLEDSMILESLFFTKDGEDHPFPRYLDPDFAKWGYYRPKMDRESKWKKK